MKVHEFKCKNEHVFFIPLNLPLDLSKFIEITKKLKCPLCECTSEEINMKAGELTVVNIEMV